MLNLSQSTDNNQAELADPPELLTNHEFIKSLVMMSKFKHWENSSSNTFINHGKRYAKYSVDDGIQYQFMNPSFKNKVVPYPRFTKLIIQYPLAKFLAIPRHTNEPQHIVEDDGGVGYLIANGNLEAKGMQIPDESLT
ncbi:hypothetical protein Tco_1417214 [Tanacetum coccineum]